MLRASVVFEHARWPDFKTARDTLESFGDDKVQLLVEHYDTLLDHLGCDKSKVLPEWCQLKLEIARDDNLRSMPYATLWPAHVRPVLQQGQPAPLLQRAPPGRHCPLVHCYAIDTAICERGFSLMNLLKTARRSKMGTKLLRMLMVICSLGAEWKDPTKVAESHARTPAQHTSCALSVSVLYLRCMYGCLCHRSLLTRSSTSGATCPSAGATRGVCGRPTRSSRSSSKVMGDGGGGDGGSGGGTGGGGGGEGSAGDEVEGEEWRRGVEVRDGGEEWW